MRTLKPKAILIIYLLALCFLGFAVPAMAEDAPGAKASELPQSILDLLNADAVMLDAGLDPTVMIPAVKIFFITTKARVAFVVWVYVDIKDGEVILPDNYKENILRVKFTNIAEDGEVSVGEWVNVGLLAEVLSGLEEKNKKNKERDKGELTI